MRTLSQLSFILLGAALCGGVAASAQTPDQTAPAPAPIVREHAHHGPDAAHQVKFLTKKLGLTPDQAAQVEPILAERDQKMADLHASDSNMTVKQMHQQMRAIMEDSKQKLDGVLNDQQKQQLAEMKSERRHHGRGGDQGAAAPAPAPTA
ncbi:hypothetical protein [Granulicella tundricola]|uniref:Periplasmic heavy metal sensor n=1 Tax=Granulicella tundricola (strain ATCC BAA-1859 / DSM 23138 / MP5ACTX9) TaxID=1198114 RepID=E8X378_GRATM|nr:hypothetical protein [Granulicella tundricola]ADW69302.1 hypothetical protein AciX9_2264 [Granulicella tundricola MP5ACTX9]